MAETTAPQAAAERGAAFLDEQLPGWDQFIDREEFRIGSGKNCILAQLARKDARLAIDPRVANDSNFYCAAIGVFHPGADFSAPTGLADWARERGFLVNRDEDPVKLQLAWIQLLGQRQAAKEAS